MVSYEKILKVGPEEYEKIRIGKKLIPIKQFILIISSSFSIIFFILGIMFKLYLDYTLFAALIFICFIIGAFPYLLYASLKVSEYEKIAAKYPAFLRDFSEAISSGMSIVQALKHISNLDYGPLTPFIKKLYTWVSWGVSFDKALEKLNEYFRDIPLIKRANGVLIEAYIQGGDIGKILRTVADDLESIKNLEKNRKSQTSQQIIVLYIVFFVFAGLMIMLKNVLEPLIATQLFLKAQQQAGGVFQTFTFGEPIEMSHFKMIVTLSLIIESIFIGLIIGIAESGKIQAGFKHVIITLMISTALLFIFIIPEKVSINLMVYPLSPYVGQKITIEGSVTIDATPAKGNISLIIVGYTVRKIPLENGRFKESFTVDKPGNYTVIVKYIYRLKVYEKKEKIEVKS